jgi:hypothetical protein
MERAHSLDNVLFVARNNHDACHRCAQVGPSSYIGIKPAGARQVDLGRLGEFLRQLGIVYTTTSDGEVPTGNCCHPRQEGSELQVKVVHRCDEGLQQKGVSECTGKETCVGYCRYWDWAGLLEATAGAGSAIYVCQVAASARAAARGE